MEIIVNESLKTLSKFVFVVGLLVVLFLLKKKEIVF